MKCIRMLTFLPMEEIEAMSQWEGSKLNEAKDILAYELTTLVHGEEEANKAREASKALFGGGADTSNMPTCELTDEDFDGGEIDLSAILVKSGLCTSRSDARRAAEQGGISVNNEKETDFRRWFTKEDIGDEIIVKRGKKKFMKIICK